MFRESLNHLCNLSTNQAEFSSSKQAKVQNFNILSKSLFYLKCVVKNKMIRDLLSLFMHNIYKIMI